VNALSVRGRALYIDDAATLVVAGNYDGNLPELRSEAVHEEYAVEYDTQTSASLYTVVCHGHEPPSMDADRYAVGRDHPTIEIEGVRHPCALFGPGVVVNGMRSGGTSRRRSPTRTRSGRSCTRGRVGVLEFTALGEFRGLP